MLKVCDITRRLQLPQGVTYARGTRVTLRFDRVVREKDPAKSDIQLYFRFRNLKKFDEEPPLVLETDATKVTVIHDQWAESDSTYGATVDGWPRILSRLKTLIETGKTFKPH